MSHPFQPHRVLTNEYVGPLAHDMRNRSFRWSTMVALFATVLVTQASVTRSLHAQTGPQLDATHSVLVQPIICRDDDGADPARKRIVEKIIDQPYSAAQVDIHFLEPIYYDNTQTRDGLVPLDTIADMARRDGVLRSPERIINIFFVNAVDGKPGPVGRSRTPGWHVLIAMGPGGPNPDDIQDAFLVAHEIGHSLGLASADDDPNVNQDIPNLMKAGPLEDRISPLGLNRQQIVMLQQSPLVRPNIDCLSPEESQRAILDDSYGGYFSKIQQREIGTLTGAPVQCNDLMVCQDEARRRFVANVLPFTEREVEAITWFVERIRERIGDDYGLFRRQPWRFIKVHDDLAGGFSHTRAASIIFSQRTIERIVRARNEPNEIVALRSLAPLFVHEQMHVLERFFPQRFQPMFEELLGFQRAKVESHPWLDERQILNPDAIDMDWVISTRPDNGQQGWFNLRTILRDGPEVPVMGKDFVGVAVRVLPAGDRFRIDVDETSKPRWVPIENLSDFIARLPVENGLDHPNEIAAYMFQQILVKDYLSTDSELDEVERHPIYAKFRRWCRANLN